MRLRQRLAASARGGPGGSDVLQDFSQQVCELLEQGQDLVVATIMHHRGSTPRTAGTRMLVLRDGRDRGTIGGGLLEARVTAKAREVLDRRRPHLMFLDLGHDDVAGVDMICGGEVEVLLDYLRPDKPLLDLFRRRRRLWAAGEEGFLVTTAVLSETGIERTDHCLVEAEGRIRGDVPFAPDLLEALLKETRKTADMQVVDFENFRVVVEPTMRPKTVFLFGAGHVSQPTARLAAMVGFRVVVLDDRLEFANRQRFPEADEVRVLPGFDAAFEQLPVSSHSFVVIVTRGHLYDKTVLGRALETDAGYIGMIGSRRKRDAIFQALLSEGFKRTDLRRVHAPIGLEIGAETPEEIAVSIVAELIRVRARQR
jgi:xanthine dehydrogenase accessory factor